MTKATMKFFPHVEKKSKKNGKIPMYMRVISNCKKAESRLPIEVFESEIQNWNKIIQRFENNKSSANRFLTKYEKEFEGLKYSLSEQSKEIKNILNSRASLESPLALCALSFQLLGLMNFPVEIVILFPWVEM